MDYVQLRQILSPFVDGLKDLETHERLGNLCDRLGLPSPDYPGSKRDRMRASFAALPDAELPHVALKFLELYPPSAIDRNLIQDLVWTDVPTPVIPKKYRQELARAIAIEDLYIDGEQFQALLERLWILGPADEFAMSFGRYDDSLRGEINQHVYRNPGDWSVEYLFKKLGVFGASERRFALFIEGLASADVRPDEEAQRVFVGIVNGTLKKCGAEMRETATEGGYPVFSLVSTRSALPRTPKNLIFASPVKPDLRFRDALNNDIEIVTNANKVLVYERPIGTEGLLWRDLQSWWAEARQIVDADKAKRTLYRRLRASLPENSPPQVILFDSFYKAFGNAVPDLPALIPEVWLHWDPKTVQERGVLALTRFRMDFLLLLPNGIRVVVEVDGRSHYADAKGAADPVRYSAMVAADRDLQLAGYEIYHFGAEELGREDAEQSVKAFFSSLFKKHATRIPPGTTTLPQTPPTHSR